MLVLVRQNSYFSINDDMNYKIQEHCKGIIII